MKKEPLLIVGSSGHAKVIIDIVEKEGRYDIVGLLDAFKEKGSKVCDYEILGKEEDLPELMKKFSNVHVIIAIGDNHTRQLVYDKLLSVVPAVSFGNAIHPSAVIGRDVTWGKGIVVMAGATINSGSEIGDFTIINTQASLDHDGKMGAFSSLAPGVICGGNVSIGNFSAISIGATVKHGITIGEHSVIGAGSVVLKDCDKESVYYGAPARFIRKRAVGEKYL